MEEFLKKQVQILDKHKIVYHSIEIELKFNETEQKLKKNPMNMPSYKDKKLNKYFNSSKNALIIPLGKKYNLIGVDVDNKNDTIDFFNNLAIDNEFDLNTLSVRTINDGMHYYFRLNEEQQEGLNDFMSSTGLCFTTVDQERNLDIKYTNQVFFGPSHLLHNKKIHKYEIESDTEPVILPDYLYNEILRVHINQNTLNVKSIKQKKIKKIDKISIDIKPEKPKNNNKQPIKYIIDKEKEYRCQIYLDCLNLKRFDDRDEWLSISAIIFNECKSYDLFEEYSKKSNKYTADGCIDLWNSFTDDREKKVSIKKLIEMAKEDAVDDFQKAEIKDKIGIFNTLFNDGVSDLQMSYLFKNLNYDNFIFDPINESWYSINEYGLYIVDKQGNILKDKMNKCLISSIKNEYVRLNDIFKNDSDKKKIIFIKYQGLIKYCSTSRNKDSMLKELKLLYRDDKIYEKMDSVNPYLIGFENGVYDLEHDEFRNAKPDEYISCTTQYEYKKADPLLKIEAMKIFESIFSDPLEMNYVMKQLSLGLYGGNPQEQFYIWRGSAANGKSLLRDIVQKVLGSYYDVLDISYLYQNNVIRADAPNPIISRKKNVRLVITTEPESSQIIKSSVVKSITGADPIQCRGLYSNSFNYVPKYALVIQTNNEPTFAAFDGGMSRRAIMITFRNKFVENPVLPYERLIDKMLKKKITVDGLYLNEFCEILIDYYKLYIVEQMKMPEKYAEETRLFIKDNDPVNSWIDERIQKTNNTDDLVQSSKLYEDFLSYVDNESKGVTTCVFKNLLQTAGIIMKRKNNGNYYCCIKLKRDDVTK